MEIRIIIAVILLIGFIAGIIMNSQNKVVLFTNKADKILVIASGILFTIGVFSIDITNDVTALAIICFIIAAICFAFSAWNSIEAHRGFALGIVVTIVFKAAVVYLTAMAAVVVIVYYPLRFLGFTSFRRD
jgi:hypothetical protein